MMAIFHQQIPMIIDGENNRWLCPEGSMWNLKFLGDAITPNKKGVSNETGYRGLLCTQVSEELLNVQNHISPQGFHKLIMIQRSVKFHGQSIANLSRADVEARAPGKGDQRILAVMGLDDVGMARFCINKRDNNALGCKLLCEIKHGNNVALQGKCKRNHMQRPATPVIAIADSIRIAHCAVQGLGAI